MAQPLLTRPLAWTWGGGASSLDEAVGTGRGVIRNLLQNDIYYYSSKKRSISCLLSIKCENYKFSLQHENLIYYDDRPIPTYNS